MLVSTCELLRCLACRSGSLDPVGASGDSIEEGSLRCTQCGRNYEVKEGIPLFLDEQLSISSEDNHFATLNQDSQQKVKQREWHDRACIEQQDFEYVKFSYRSPALYASLIYYDLREVEDLLSSAPYQRIANLCCGHGFELEFLSQLGDSILALDISWNSLRKTRLKGRELGINVEALCCDAENLPLKDNSFDLVLTHHSFHHLPVPIRGLEEMARVSRYRLALFEPAKGIMRTVVTKLGVKPETEESGNFVYEFGREEIESFCARHNLVLRRFYKYLISPPASEPAWFRRMDAWGITPILSGLISRANRQFGSLIGTKCGVVLEKEVNGGGAGSPSN
jgi:ubiquinone/menaquinone biosynthesis C-methylase UbiE/uncharacterized protein YbaR (Trm112 family)